ncbi:uncharacterized protein EV420DRAFT_842933 [Desarmillaria tabescens]|uniref:Uncharacterized protein n=1 Tax=Armillaria tabescens TaxID=1929756 RepID=A0AA39JTD3_ARMTA|nr:uncharacterized protein EV420DRAFT_842933 [Desarmillaria tabescens]KAK0448439.1 hypothetical protein EV420DRAFT_842933 [Desarmillaria tabescens]
MRSLPRYSYFADCKLYIRTRLLASAFSNFWNSPTHLTFREDVTLHLRKTSVSYCSSSTVEICNVLFQIFPVASIHQQDAF